MGEGEREELMPRCYGCGAETLQDEFSYGGEAVRVVVCKSPLHRNLGSENFNFDVPEGIEEELNTNDWMERFEEFAEWVEERAREMRSEWFGKGPTVEIPVRGEDVDNFVDAQDWAVSTGKVRKSLLRRFVEWVKDEKKLCGEETKDGGEGGRRPGCLKGLISH